MSKTKEILTDQLLAFLYQTRKVMTCRSIMQYTTYDYWYAVGQERKNREATKKEIDKRKKKAYNAIRYLKQKGFVDLKGDKVLLTESGEIRSILAISKEFKPQKEKGVFYLIVFDIPENQRRVRDLFRKVLYNFSAEMIQKSVFLVRNKRSFLYLKDLAKKSKIYGYVKFIECVKLYK